jgi:hypothetical protein
MSAFLRQAYFDGHELAGDIFCAINQTPVCVCLATQHFYPLLLANFFGFKRNLIKNILKYFLSIQLCFIFI